MDHPHLRGEYLSDQCTYGQTVGSPPLAWGIHLGQNCGKYLHRITPTCVGNTVNQLVERETGEDHPHLRGEYTFGRSIPSVKRGSPPLAWGIPWFVGGILLGLRITPTCVGNTYFIFNGVSSAKDHPHLRGEYLSGQSAKVWQLGSPPLAWGILVTVSCCFCQDQDHPHLRGEYLPCKSCLFVGQGSPPLAWGILALRDAIVNSNGITPTCVGNTPSLTRSKSWRWDHPHLRGEYRDSVPIRFNSPGSPPLAWGILIGLVRLAMITRITPTCVGNTQCRSKFRSSVWDHPHLRGEYRL